MIHTYTETEPYWANHFERMNLQIGELSLKMRRVCNSQMLGCGHFCFFGGFWALQCKESIAHGVETQCQQHNEVTASTRGAIVIAFAQIVPETELPPDNYSLMVY